MVILSREIIRKGMERNLNQGRRQKGARSTWTDLHKMKLEIMMRTHSEKGTQMVEELLGSAPGTIGEHEATEQIFTGARTKAGIGCQSNNVPLLINAASSAHQPL